MSYQARNVSVDLLDATYRESMSGLYLRHYDGSDEVRFFSDLSAKDEVILVLHKGGIVGFTTFSVYRRTWRGLPIRLIYSGDTIVDAAHWGQQALAFAWIERMGQIWRQEPDTALYWFLIVKGHRTYKYLPTFGRSFHPHWSDPRPDLAELADELAREKFGDAYNPATGVVEFTESRGHLKSEYADPAPEELKKEAVRFFLERNPGYRQGHELVCLCEISLDNMKPLTRRLFTKGQP